MLVVQSLTNIDLRFLASHFDQTGLDDSVRRLWEEEKETSSQILYFNNQPTDSKTKGTPCISLF